jgi:hypothetical protein
MRPSTAAPSYSLERSLSLDNTIARACLRAARLARLNLGLIYGQANGWTCHSGHKTLESFSNYIHPTDEGRIVSMQALDNVDAIFASIATLHLHSPLHCARCALFLTRLRETPHRWEKLRNYPRSCFQVKMQARLFTPSKHCKYEF